MRSGAETEAVVLFLRKTTKYIHCYEADPAFDPEGEWPLTTESSGRTTYSEVLILSVNELGAV
jgi:hypothetical protein